MGTNHKKILKAIINELKKFKKNQWIKGEYKYMKIGSIMPAGWIKITDNDNLLLGSNRYHFSISIAVGEDKNSEISQNQVSTLNIKETELWEYNPILYAEIIAMGLTPHEYAEIEKQK